MPKWLPVASQAIRQIAGQESGPRGGEVVKYRRHSLDFAKTDMNPAAADEPRSPQGARTQGALSEPRSGHSAARVDLPRRQAPSSRPTGQRLRRDATTWHFRPREHCAGNSAQGLLILPHRGNCHAFTAKGSPDLHDAKRSCHGTLGTKRSTACRCRAVDPIVFLLRTIIPLIRERPAARGCFEAFPPLQPASHRRRSREAGGRFPYRCRI